MTTDLERDLAELARALREITVAVHTGGGSGSGVVWDARGIVITNAHVVRGAHAEVETAAGRRVRARLAGRDDRRDLAVLRVDPVDAGITHAAPRRDATTLVPGELVVAVGNPHGIPGAVTAGLVHHSGSRWVVADVRLAPGNSGGPLADATGHVVGINSAIVRGLGYAVPAGAVADFLRSLREGARAA